jgi:hypothetical protein
MEGRIGIMRSGNTRRAILGLVVISLSACSPPAASVASAPVASPSAASPSLTPSASPSFSASPVASPSPVAGLEWAQLPHDPVFVNASIQGLTADDEGMFAYGFVRQPEEGKVEGAIWRTADGRAWERVSGRAGFEDAGVGSLARGVDGSYLAAGTTCHFECGGARLWKSRDGLEWVEVTVGVPQTWWIEMFAAGTGWIVSGTTTDPTPPTLWSSVDGTTWVPATGLGREDALVRGVVTLPTKLVAYGSSYPGADSLPAIWTSVDGSRWTPVAAEAAPSGQGISAVAEIDGALAAFVRDADGMTVWTSEDGLAWEERGGDFAIGGEHEVVIFGLVEGGPGLVALGKAVTPNGQEAIGAWLSADGSTWRPATDVTAFEGVQSVWAAAAHGSTLYAAGELKCDVDCPQQGTFWISPPS